MILPFLLSWIYQVVVGGPHLPFGNENPNLNHIDKLWDPFMFAFELVFLGIVFAPILAGLMGIWGLSKRMITWAVGYFLMVVGIHALLTFEGITEAVDVGLQPLPAQIGDATLYAGLFSPLSLTLISIAILIIVFMESRGGGVSSASSAGAAAAKSENKDAIQRAGNYPPPAGQSDLPGLEVSGEIVALGDGASSVSIGDTVCALTPGGRSYADDCHSHRVR